MPLNAEAQKIHDRAVYLANVYRKAELDLVEVLIRVVDLKIDRQLRFTSLYKYIMGALNICRSHAYALDGVVRRARSVPALREALRDGRVTVSGATRLLSVLNRENARDVIAYAAEHSQRETDVYLAKLRPRAAKKDRTRPLAGDLYHIEGSISSQCQKKYERAKEILMSKSNDVGLNEVLEAALDEYLFKHDPVEKAKRAEQRRTKPVKKSENVCAIRKIRVSGLSRRAPIPADVKHTVFRRDNGQCTFVDANGCRCTERKWIHLHHVKPVSLGGDNTPENLTTLCSAHHDLVHQLSLPIDGQVTWFR